MSRLVLVLMVLGACSSDGGNGGSGSGTMADAAAPPIDAVAAATVTGSLHRSANPNGDGKGSIYIALFDKDPVIDRNTALVVARSVISDVDLATTSTTVSYTLEAVPPRETKYYFVAFLDDNGNVDLTDPTKAGPDKGDLVTLDGLASPKVLVPTPTTVTFDSVLNTVLPF